jgi:hypothetical protein
LLYFLYVDSSSACDTYFIANLPRSAPLARINGQNGITLSRCGTKIAQTFFNV